MAAGTLVGERIRLDEPLGSGAMGTVWLATHLTLDTRVAVKVQSAAVQSLAARRRFELEARAVAQLTSPHVVKVFDYGVTEDDAPYIVMELLEGEDLAERLERQGRLSLEQTAQIVAQAAKGLGAAHEAGIVHRDVKPANIFLAKSGREELVKLVDFGIAKRVDGLGASLTHSGAVLGTPYFMSPEQLIAPKDVDARTDLWSLGVVVYACLTGEVPFDGETLGALTIAINEGHFRAPTTLRPDLPQAVDDWMARALARDKEERFATAEELATALEAVAAAPPPPARELEAADTERDPTMAMVAARSRRPLGLALGLGVTALVIGAGAWLWLVEGEPEPSPSPDRGAPAKEETKRVTTVATVTTVTTVAKTATAPASRAQPSASAVGRPASTGRSAAPPPPAGPPGPPPRSKVKPKGLGSACSAPWQCKSGFCVDGVCCDQSCHLLCVACSIALKGGGMAGVCGPIADRRDPQGDCPGPEVCDGQGYCYLPKD